LLFLPLQLQTKVLKQFRTTERQLKPTFRFIAILAIAIAIAIDFLTGLFSSIYEEETS